LINQENPCPANQKIKKTPQIINFKKIKQETTMETTRTQMKINLKKTQTNNNSSVFNVGNHPSSGYTSQGLGSRNGATSPFFVRKSNDRSSNSSHDGKSSHSDRLEEARQVRRSSPPTSTIDLVR